jgi:transcriptional regulator GlxA family with amidase domain
MFHDTKAGVQSDAELIRQSEVSERSLQYAFMDRFGVSPKRYIIALRINLARK